MKYTLQIYIVPSVDWHQHWRNRSSSFGGEANTNYYPSEKNNRMDGQTDGHTDYYMAYGAIITTWLKFGFSFKHEHHEHSVLNRLIRFIISGVRLSWSPFRYDNLHQQLNMYVTNLDKPSLHLPPPNKHIDNWPCLCLGRVACSPTAELNRRWYCVSSYTCNTKRRMKIMIVK